MDIFSCVLAGVGGKKQAKQGEKMENYDSMKKEIGQRVAEVRKRAGDKQTDLAEALGVDVRTYRTREIGTATRSPECGRSTPST